MIRRLFSRETLSKAWKSQVASYALVLGLLLLCRWLDQPVGGHGGPSFTLAVFVVLGALWLLSHDRFERMLGRFNAPTSGEWRTTRAERLRLLLPIPFSLLFFAWAFRTGWGLWWIADLPRLASLGAITLLLATLMTRNTLRILRAKVELRVDEAGVFAPAWRRTIAWDDIAFALKPGRERELRLMLTEEAFKSVGRRDGMLTLKLAPTGLYADEALAALRAVRPGLRIELWASNGFVLPIHGATDVPDMAKVTTYG